MCDVEFEYNGVAVYVDEDVYDWDSKTRRPYYRLRGKRITEQQAFEVIRRTDTFFSWLLHFDDCEDHYYHADCIASLNFNMWWFESSHYPGKYGWVHPNGIVGLNGITQRYPNRDELVEEWTDYAKNFPFLDLVVAITYWDEHCSERYDEEEKLDKEYYDHKISREEYSRKTALLDLIDFERNGLEDSIEVGVWLHDGAVEIMSKRRTVKKYLEYEKLYPERDRQIFMPEYYGVYQPDIVTREYLCRCLAAYGIEEPEKFLSGHVQQNEIRNLK